MAAQVKELKESKVAARHFRTSSGWRTLREKETETIDDERINLIILLLPVDPILGLERETADNLPALQVTTQGSGKTGSGTMETPGGMAGETIGAGRKIGGPALREARTTRTRRAGRDGPTTGCGRGRCSAGTNRRTLPSIVEPSGSSRLWSGICRLALSTSMTASSLARLPGRHPRHLGRVGWGEAGDGDASRGEKGAL